MELKKFTVELFTSTIVPGMILKGDCFDDAGKRYIDSSKPVTAEEIEKLQNDGVKKVYYTINKLLTKNTVENSAISDESFDKAYSIMYDIQKGIEEHRLTIPVHDLKEVVKDFIVDIEDNENSFLSLLDVSNIDEYTYSHSINVSTIAIMMGMILNLDYNIVVNLGISGLLLDIGKGLIPKDVLLKREKLTNEELKMIRCHTIYGYNLLKSDPKISKEILDGVLLHHEQYLGGGYPLNINHEKMGVIPQILAICDTFDAATSKKPYRDSNPFTQTISYIMENSSIKFNPIYAQTFLNHMIRKLFDKPIYYIGAFVLLNTGEIAYILDYRSDPYTLRPIINIILNPENRDKVLRYHQQINLERDNERRIIRRIDDPETIMNLVRIECKGNEMKIAERLKCFKEFGL